MARTRRTYDQYCGLARALEVVGERWTLLIVRELLLGPKRYKDLFDGLPGIATNLLAERLRDLEQAGVLRRRTLAPPAGSTVYELTEFGRELEPAVLALGRWGVSLLGEPRPNDGFRPGWYVLSMLSTFRPESAEGLRESYEFRIGDEVFEVRVADRRVEARQGEAHDPDFVLTASLETLLALLGRRLAPEEALVSRRAEIEGDPSVLARCIDILAWPAPADAAAKGVAKEA